MSVVYSVDYPGQAGKVAYPLDEVLLLALMAVLAGAEGFTDIARFGEKKLELLRRFRPFRNGTPSHDHLGDLFAALDAPLFSISGRSGAVSWPGWRGPDRNPCQGDCH